ncbi:LAMI_0D13080g1_1 [Lachancea mirantina]|uniref:Mitochondrial inner membrane protease subunit n=1 Tax=Lachancea mirantina TaxID=1230905 RepID=A0A1G4JG59_9SACH|nr:LAMI_0D13080g1_1 [Lachancea mirantina]
MPGESGFRLFFRASSFALRSFCFIHIIHSHVYEFTETRGESMLPTLAATSDYVHALKRYSNGRDCKIGDCIIAAKPTDPHQRVCKRITGMPGDLILVDPSMGSNVSQTDEDYDDHFNSFIKVPKGHVWVTGDNLSQSLDSRTYNSLPMGLIKGKIVAANDLNEPFWGGKYGSLWGFRKINNIYIDER